MDVQVLEGRKARARTWFERLRDDICAAFEAIEDALPSTAPVVGRAAGRFERTPWQRTDHSGAAGGGGVMVGPTYSSFRCARPARSPAARTC